MSGRKVILTIFAAAILLLARAGQDFAKAAKPTPTPVPSLSLISFIRDGALWLTNEDGTEPRVAVQAPEGGSVANQLWARDGSRIYYNIGYKVYAYLVRDKKIEELGQLGVPDGAIIDRFEAANDSRTLLFHTLDPNDVLGSVPHVFAFSGSPATTRELSVDEYHLLAPAQSPVIRNPGDMSVSPDGKLVLFSEAVGSDMQLFVADVETGARHQVTSLSGIDGFEPEATPDGGRRLLEATWLPDSRHIVFVPAQSCSEFGLCSGKMYMSEAWGSEQLQLATQLSAGISQEWNFKRNLLVYDDGGQVLVSDIGGQVRQVATGNQPRWQPGL